MDPLDFDAAELVVIPFHDTELDAELQAREADATWARAAVVRDRMHEAEKADSLTHWEHARNLVGRMALFVAGATVVGLLVVAYVRHLP